MKVVSRRFSTPFLILVFINVVGLIWIHHDLTGVRTATVFADEVKLSPNKIIPDRLQIHFDRDIIETGQVGQVGGQELFRLTPTVAGIWKWASLDTLEFHFDEPLPPGRRYELVATESFASETGLALGGGQTFEVATVALALNSFHLKAIEEHHVSVEFHFNQPVDPGDLLRHITFWDHQTEVTQPFKNIQCLTKAANQTLVVRLPRPASNRLGMQLEASLAGPNADLALGKVVKRVIDVGSGFCYLSHYVTTERLEVKSNIRLDFSERLSHTQLLPKLRVVPAVDDLTVHRSYSQLVLTGSFEPETRYTVYIPKDLRSNSNETLGDEVPVQIEIDARRSALRFGQRQGFMTPYGHLSLDLKAVNVPEISLLTWNLQENNLIPYLQGHERRATSRLMPKKTVDLDIERNRIQDFALDITELTERKPGVYCITAQAQSPRWTSTRAVVTVTDLAITAKQQQEGSLVWVTSLRTGQPVPDVTVRAWSYNNQVLATAETDAEGLAQLPYAHNHPDGDMWVITAKQGEDLSYLQPDENQWVIEDVDRRGRHYLRDIEVLLYTERGVYRPGDDVHLTGIARRRQGQVPPVLPYQVKVTRPDGKEVVNRQALPTEQSQGIFHMSLPTERDDQTGAYHVTVTLPGDDTVIGYTDFLVEAFLPQRMKVHAEPTAERYDPNGIPTVQVTSRYLWDEPVAEASVKVEPFLRELQYRSNKAKDYVFGKVSSGHRRELKTVSELLDDQGKAQLAVHLPSDLSPGLYTMSFTTTVTEPGARSVSCNTQTVVDTLDHHLGLRCPEERLVQPAEPVTFDWMSLDGTGQERPVNLLSLRLDLIEYDTVLKEVNGRRVWRSVERSKQIETRDLVCAGKMGGGFDVTCPDAGRYRLTLSDPNTGSRTLLDLYASEQSAQQSLAMNQPESLEIVTDQATYLPGETAQVLVRSPIEGTLLLTVESDQVVTHQIVALTNNTADVNVPLSPKLRGGAYVSGTVVRAIDPNETNWLPHRAMGMTRVRIDHQDSKLPIRIHAPEKSEPGQTITLDIETRPALDPNAPGMVHVWAVDEGILLPTAYETPNPFAFFLGARRPGVYSADLFYRLLPDYQRPTSIARIGADDEYEMGALRRNPVATVRRQPDVVWSQAVPLDANGFASIDFNLPDLTGQMRVMAVTVDHDAYGHHDQQVLMTSDLMIEASWPRFVAPGDQFEMPVKLFNTTDQTMSILLDIEIGGGIDIADYSAVTTPFEVVPDKPLTKLFKVTAKELGPVHVQIRAQATLHDSTIRTWTTKASLGVRPAASLHSEVVVQTLEAGETLTIEPAASFVPGTQELNLSISPRPSVQLAPALEELMDYPYGCVEQTTSRLMALLYAPSILGEAHKSRVDQLVQAGLARLWSMQTLSGGLSYWPGGTESDPWGSAYVGWCLAICKEVGVTVEPRFQMELVKYLKSQLQSTTRGSEFDPTRALICHCLSILDTPPYGWMDRLAEGRGSLDPAAIAHVVGAFQAAGKTDRARELLFDAAAEVKSPRLTTRGRLTSPGQQNAVWLATLLTVDPDHAQVVPRVKQLLAARKNGAWMSTLENAAAILALSRYQILTQAETVQYTGTLLQDQTELLTFDQNEVASHKIDTFKDPLTLKTQGQGRINLCIQSEGLAAAGVVKPYDQRLSVRRRWLDRFGFPIDVNAIHVGDLINVEIEMKTLDGTRVNNIAVVDALPGGLEIENPRFDTSAASALELGEEPDHFEMLDDRVVFFCSASKRKKIYRYALRATAAGDFVCPAIQASCMYDPYVVSLGEVTRIQVMP